MIACSVPPHPAPDMTSIMQPVPTTSPPPLTDDEITLFANIVGKKHALTDEADKAGHLIERRGLYHGATPLVLKPKTTDEVARIMALATRLKRPIVPQGGNTGLVGGQIPFEHGNEILLNLSRLSTLR